MFERYTEAARRSLFFARYEASVLGSPAIETEHLLLGLLKQPAPLVARLIGTGYTTAAELRQLIYSRAISATPIDQSVEIPFSSDSKMALSYTAEEAERLLHREIWPEHLLLGLLRHDRGLAWDVLSGNGLSIDAVRETLVMHVSATTPLPPAVAKMAAAMERFSVGPLQERSTAVYFITTLDGPSPGRRAAEDRIGTGVFSSFSAVEFGTLAQHAADDRVERLGPIKLHGTTLAQFAVLLEAFLGAPVMVDDDASMRDLFDIELQGTYENEEALTAALRDQLGLELTKGV